MTRKLVLSSGFFLISILFHNVYSQSKFKLAPVIEVGIAQRSVPFELSEFSNLPGSSDYTYQYNSNKHFRNFSLSLAIQQFVLKKRISVQVASYFRYNHLHYGKNAQGVSSDKEKEFKRLKYDLFIDGIYHFKKRKANSVGVLLGLGIGEMNLGTIFKDSTWRGSDYIAFNRGFRILAPRLIAGISKNNFSFFAIAHGTPDSEYRSNPSIWLEFKGAYSFSPFKKKKTD